MRVKALRAEFKAGNLAEVLAVRIPASIKRTTEPVDEVYPEYVTDDYTTVHPGRARTSRPGEDIMKIQCSGYGFLTF